MGMADLMPICNYVGKFFEDSQKESFLNLLFIYFVLKSRLLRSQQQAVEKIMGSMQEHDFKAVKWVRKAACAGLASA